MAKAPDWICSKCGEAYCRGWPVGHVGTFHVGICGVCGGNAAVTEPYDYGGMRPGWALEAAADETIRALVGGLLKKEE